MTFAKNVMEAEHTKLAVVWIQTNRECFRKFKHMLTELLFPSF